MKKDIKWFEWLYQADTNWDIISLWNWKTNSWIKTLKPWINRQWYYLVLLCKKWVRTTKRINRIIAETFIDNSDNKPQVNHINWIKTDNRVKNLEWVTCSDNIKHSFKNRLQVIWKWKDNHSSKAVWQFKDWELVKEFWSILEAERETWIGNSSISRVCRKIYWFKSAWGFTWEYL